VAGRQADVVRLHAVLSESTRHLIDGPRLALMKDDAILNQWPVWGSAEVRPFLTDPAPQAAPSIVNAADLGLPVLPDPAGPA
jgi:hypothetical protein